MERRKREENKPASPQRTGRKQVTRKEPANDDGKERTRRDSSTRVLPEKRDKAGSGDEPRSYRTKPEKRDKAGSGDEPRGYRSKPEKRDKSGSGDEPRSYRPKTERHDKTGSGDEPRSYRPKTERHDKAGSGDEPRRYKPHAGNSSWSPKQRGHGHAGKASSRRTSVSEDGLIRLNKYIANSGICSRREADELILAGVVMVNGKVVTELGTKITPSDKVQYDNQTIRNERHVYVLLNKPKGYITTTDDPFDRKTVMTLVADACKERIYPVGRLDRNTTGLLLLTNDGEMAKKLTHPRHRVRKIYHVELDKAITKNDMITIAKGVELDDGPAVVDEIAYAEGGSKKEVGVELHSGKNRIVRRIFESMGYEVVRLDRVLFAGLTKKDLPRGHWRLLTEQEVNYLKMLK